MVVAPGEKEKFINQNGDWYASPFIYSLRSERAFRSIDRTVNDEEILREAWEDFNKLEETEGDHTSVDEFIIWFNEQYVTQIERLYLEFIQP